MAVRVIDPILAASVAKAGIVPLVAYGATTSVVLDLRGLKEKSLLVQNTGATALTWNIMGSLDDGANYDYQVKADNAVAPAGQEFYNNSQYMTHWLVQLKSAGATTATVKLAAVGV